MNEQVSLAKAQWKNELCPFETVKTWRAGVSIKCADHTVISQGKGADDDGFILKKLRSKRQYDCIRCLQRLVEFQKHFVPNLERMEETQQP